MALMPMIQSRVTADADGGIHWRGHRWLEVEPLDARGAITRLHAWGATYERIGWWEQAPFHLSVLAVCFLSFIAYAISAAIRGLRRRETPTDGRAASRCALAASIVNVMFVCGLPFVFAALRAATPPPPLVLIAWLMLPLASAAATSLLPGFAVLAWREQWWTRGARLRFSTMAVLSVAFLTFLNYWKLFGVS
jgi:hypothetical protein